MSRFISRFVKDESGATAIEYGLIAALIAVVIIGALQTVGGNLTTTYTTVAGACRMASRGVSSSAGWRPSRRVARASWRLFPTEEGTP
jgi:pilus assembly protein Flp/PilA